MDISISQYFADLFLCNEVTWGERENDSDCNYFKFISALCPIHLYKRIPVDLNSLEVDLREYQGCRIPAWEGEGKCCLNIDTLPDVVLFNIGGGLFTLVKSHCAC